MNHEVLAIRHVHFEDLGSLELVLGERSRPVRYLDVGFARIEAPDPAAPSLMVILGGPISASDDARYPTITPLLSMIEKRIAAGLPTLGICLGAQLIARALGARVYRAPQTELGWTPLTLTEAGRASPLRHLDGTLTSIGTEILSTCQQGRRTLRPQPPAKTRHSVGANMCWACNVTRKSGPTVLSRG
jgi:GMP synthase (glutamine-hydrolysing)